VGLEDFGVGAQYLLQPVETLFELAAIPGAEARLLALLAVRNRT
jgi:hypothetical protein